MLSCAQQREEERDNCRKRVEPRIFQTCINERINSEGPPTEYADQFCIISLLEYSQCSDF